MMGKSQLRLGQTERYSAALAALNTLRDKLGITPELQAIAQFLLYANEVEAPRSPFVWVGTDSPQDRQFVQAWNQVWQDFLNGDPLPGDEDY